MPEEVPVAGSHPVAGLVFQVSYAEKFPKAPGLETLDSFFFRVSKQCPRFTVLEEDGGDKSLVELA